MVHIFKKVEENMNMIGREWKIQKDPNEASEDEKYGYESKNTVGRIKNRFEIEEEKTSELENKAIQAIQNIAKI